MLYEKAFLLIRDKRNYRGVIQLDPDKVLVTRFFQDQPVILVVTCNGHLTESVMGYSLNVAGRLNHRLLVAYVNTMPFLWEGGFRSRRFALAVKDNFSIMQERSQKRGIIVNHIKESGNIGRVVSRLCRIVKKIEFIIVDDGVSVEKVVSRACVPVFNVDKLVKAKP
ncbi:hypothetical protein [Desulfosediminicola flagellatus]|uniref:hypothetical protein n=1 Tax=Desulfosediminicola flagellatus TaxID=2569541 RepID=UPI0010AC29B5|nr:hypothetical protein [Desulfosediminicola flagellatus]